MTERYDFSNDKFPKMLRCFSVVEAYGLIYFRPLGENSSFATRHSIQVIHLSRISRETLARFA